MADRLYKAQIIIPLDSGIPEDNVVNTLYFDDDSDPLAGAEDTQGWIMELVTAYLNTIDGIFPSTVGADATVKLYDMRDPLPRVPRAIETVALTPSADGPLPNEVALVMSFSADVASGQIAARRRGRVYIGPIKTPNAEEVVGSQNRPTSAILNQVAAAGEALLAGVEHPGSPGLFCRWSIYSPTTDVTSSIDDAFNDVTHGWVDDAWDTQRRRGPAATRREVFNSGTSH